MADDVAAWEHRVVTRLTAIKLANQILDRQPGLTTYQHWLVRTALQAADGLSADLLSNLAPRGRRIVPTRLHPERPDDRSERLDGAAPPGHDRREVEDPADYRGGCPGPQWRGSTSRF